MAHQQRLTAILWDFDGTLADTRERNLRVTRRVVAHVTGRAPDGFPGLRSLAAYDAATVRAGNWRELYGQLGLTEEETDRAGAAWSLFQRRERTVSTLYEGVAAALRALGAWSHGIVSQNARGEILRTVRAAGIADRFQVVVGYEEVSARRQKPEPDGILACLARLADHGTGCILYVGDHESDMECARRADVALKERGLAITVKAVAALWGRHADDAAWRVRPDYRAHHALDIVNIAGQWGTRPSND